MIALSELHVHTGKSRLMQVENFTQGLCHQVAKWRETVGVIPGNCETEHRAHYCVCPSRSVYPKQWGRIIGRHFIFIPV